MQVAKLELFLGFPITGSLEQELGRVNPALLTLFTQGGDEYLVDLYVEGTRYLGKHLGSMSDLGELELAGRNIVSLMKRLVPSYSFQEQSLLLLSLKDPSEYRREHENH